MVTQRLEQPILPELCFRCIEEVIDTDHTDLLIHGCLDKLATDG